MTLRLAPGAPDPLGATLLQGGVNFAVFAGAAERVELCLFDRAAEREIARADLPAQHGGVWCGFWPGGAAGAVYGFRVHGPFAPERGLRYAPAKLLLDPYAKRLAGRFRWGPEHYGYTRETKDPSCGPDPRDNAATAWKGVVTAPEALSPLPSGPRIPWSRTILYELHARGFTMRLEGLSEAERGRFAGLSSPAALHYLKALGVTTLELLPVHAILHDHRLVDAGLSNHWGYNTLSFFAPHPEYAGDDPVAEMRAFVQAAHDAGLEVCLDVVYNHTCEGDAAGPTVSWRGFDDAAYYRTAPNAPGRYQDVTGCGATLDANHPIVRRMILDSLRHWASAYGVDAFRFDLATALALGTDGRFDPNAPFFHDLRACRALAAVKLIAEPWDAAGGFAVGAFPNGWAEWNAHARDAVRRFWRGDAGLAPEFARRFAGSADLYLPGSRPVWSSIQFAACHDGFTLADLTRYTAKRNRANGENNRDGADENDSANYGVEGETADPSVTGLRERQARNMLASVLLGFGTPMLLAGDEIGRTQGGNNNAYAQDNGVSWIDWRLAASEPGARMLRFVRRLIRLRSRMSCYRSEEFPAPPGHPTAPTIEWLRTDGNAMGPDDWRGEPEAFLARIRPGVDDGDVLALFVRSPTQPVRAVLPSAPGARWSSLLDSADPDLPEGARLLSPGDVVTAPPRSIHLFSSVPVRTFGKPGHGY